MKPPKTLTTEQVTMLLDNLIIDHGTTKQIRRGFRNHTIALTLLETGLRVAELCGLLLDDLIYNDEPVSTLVIRRDIAKNFKERQIPISSNLRIALNEMHYTIWSNDTSLPFSYAFYSSDNTVKLSTRSVERFILDAGKSSFNLKVTPHMLRHTFATRMMRKTNARVVQTLLGHSSLQSTQIYTHPDANDLQRAIDTKDDHQTPGFR